MQPYKLFSSLLLACCLLFVAHAQQDAPSREDLTVSYSILVKGKRSNTGIGETYNGGTKTLFVSNGVVRLRQISMMRMHDIFILPPGNPERKVAIVKESGKSKYKTYLDTAQWRKFNAKYERATCELSEEYTTIIGYACHKAIVKLTDGRTITVFYTTRLPHADAAMAEPAFASVPGLVLKYEYKYKKNSIIYTATSVSRQAIDINILKVPGKGYEEKKWTGK
ncbi:MAG: hypothetical protein QM731_00595 [Chitinophagaceae bacterium]